VYHRSLSKPTTLRGEARAVVSILGGKGLFLFFFFFFFLAAFLSAYVLTRVIDPPWVGEGGVGWRVR